MRTTRIALALALVVSPAMLKAQTTCQAPGVTGVESNVAPVNLPTCQTKKDVQTTVPNVLYLRIRSNGPIDLTANDTAAYEKTWRANNNAAGTSGGTAVPTPSLLQSAAATDSVFVLANRGYSLTIQALTDIFTFDKDAGYNKCRTTAVATTGCTGTTGTDGKSMKDLYYAVSTGSFAQIPLSTGSAASITSSTTGERYAGEINFKSAWFYATDIPGKYTATVVYTVTGQ